MTKREDRRAWGYDLGQEYRTRTAEPGNTAENMALDYDISENTILKWATYARRVDRLRDVVGWEVDLSHFLVLSQKRADRLAQFGSEDEIREAVMGRPSGGEDLLAGLRRGMLLDLLEEAEGKARQYLIGLWFEWRRDGETAKDVAARFGVSRAAVYQWANYARNLERILEAGGEDLPLLELPLPVAHAIAGRQDALQAVETFLEGRGAWRRAEGARRRARSLGEALDRAREALVEAKDLVMNPSVDMHLGYALQELGGLEDLEADRGE